LCVHGDSPLTAKWRWRRLRKQLSPQNFSPQNAVIALVVLGIVIFAIVDAIKKGYISKNTGIYIVCFVPAVILHEVSHGVVALWCGDDTAKRAGRLTLNPIKHIDPFGSILLPIIAVLTVHIPFGYAKPVPVSINRLRSPRNQAVLVGLAGPATNILLACIGGIYLHFSDPFVLASAQEFSMSTAQNFALDFGLVNIWLAAFNLIPIPPLDGSSVLERLLPERVLPQYYQMRFAFMVLVMLFVITDQGLISSILNHFTVWFLEIFTG